VNLVTEEKERSGWTYNLYTQT